MSDAAVARTAPSMLGLLLRVKARSIYNLARHAIDVAPLRVATAVMLIVLIWFMLYGLFRLERINGSARRNSWCDG